MSDEPTPAQKKIFIKTICGSTYTERDLIHLRAASDFLAGWALTKDALCVGGKISMEHNEPIDFRTYDDWRSDIIWNEGGDTTSELLAKIEQVRNQQKNLAFDTPIWRR